MKILFVSGLYSRGSEELLNKMSCNRIQNAPNVFQWSIVSGMVENNCDFEVVSFPFLPSYPLKYKRLHTPDMPIVYNGRQIGRMIGYCALAGYKYLSIERKLSSYIENWIQCNKDMHSQLVVLTYTPHFAYINAINRAVKKCAYTKITVGSIITDLVDDMLNFVANRGPLKRIQCYIEKILTKKEYKHIDKFILLAKSMEEKIPESIGANIVVEGLAIPNAYKSKENVNRRDVIFLYTGSLDEFTCVKDLVDAFMMTTSHRYRLVICGDGALNSYVLQMSKKDERIKYLGIVSRDKSVALQQQATCLVNPRKPNGAITKYSFPSKTMEYMVSGTPMIGYRLEGVPSEYYEHMYIPSDMSNESLAQIMEYVAGLDQSILNDKANKANEFIECNKTAQKQVDKIIRFMQDSAD